MPSKLRIDWATHAAALYACRNWHYSRKIPVNKLVKIGAWEDDRFIGVVIFGVGASAVLHHQFGLKNTEVCELVRVALDRHETPVTRIVRIALLFLTRSNPGLKICVSFADPSQGHHGGIYQGGNWTYAGMSQPTREYFYRGDWRHVTDVYKRLGPEGVRRLAFRVKPGKHRYVLALARDQEEKVRGLAKARPQRASSVESGTPGPQPGGGGESPTGALQSSGDQVE